MNHNLLEPCFLKHTSNFLALCNFVYMFNIDFYLRVLVFFFHYFLQKNLKVCSFFLAIL